jgi:hypothetical protein
MDRVDRPEGRGNADETADSSFHPSRPSGFGHLVHRKSLISHLKSMRGAGRTPIHLGNPGESGRPLRGATGARAWHWLITLNWALNRQFPEGVRDRGLN